MADRTGIQWTDATWNPTTGFPDGFEVTLRPDRLEIPLHWRKPRRVFVNSTSDLFHADIPDEYLCRVFDVMLTARRHTFQVLTKRHARMRSFVIKYLSGGFADLPLEDAPLAYTVDAPPPNVWLGVSVEDQKWADIRIPALLDTPAAVRFLSCEPLLGPVDLGNVRGIDWVIVGGESGAHARRMDPVWAADIRDQCLQAGVPFFFKQWGAWGPSKLAIAERQLDGIRWDQMPEVAAADDLRRHLAARAAVRRARRTGVGYREAREAALAAERTYAANFR